MIRYMPLAFILLLSISISGNTIHFKNNSDEDIEVVANTGGPTVVIQPKDERTADLGGSRWRNISYLVLKSTSGKKSRVDVTNVETYVPSVGGLDNEGYFTLTIDDMGYPIMNAKEAKDLIKITKIVHQ